MKNCFKNQRFFNILLLIFIASFLILPKFCLANNFEKINSEELSKYLELPEKDANKLMDTLGQVFTTEGILLWGSGEIPEEKIAVVVTLLKVVKMQALSHLLVDAPLEIIQKIIKVANELVQIYFEPSIALEKLEKWGLVKRTKDGRYYLLKG